MYFSKQGARIVPITLHECETPYSKPALTSPLPYPSMEAFLISAHTRSVSAITPPNKRSQLSALHLRIPIPILAKILQQEAALEVLIRVDNRLKLRSRHDALISRALHLVLVQVLEDAAIQPSVRCSSTN